MPLNQNEMKLPLELESWRKVVLENALDAFVAIDDSDLVVDWNLRAQDTFGYTKEEAIGKNMSMLIIPEKYRKSHSEGIDKFLRTGIGPILNKRIELEALHKNGTVFPVELTVIPIQVQNSFLFYSFIRDISQRKRIEKELLLRSEVLEHSLNGIDIIDEYGKFKYANPAYLKMWGYDDVNEVIGTTAVSHCKDPTIPEKIIKELKATGECDIEFVAKRKDGSFFDVRMWSRVSYDADGREIYPTTSIDITEQKKARIAIEASEDLYHSTFANAPVGIINTAPNGKLLNVNDRLCEMLGYTREELSNLTFIDITHVEDRALDQEYFNRMLFNKKSIYDREKRYIRKNGSTIWVHVTGQMLYHLDGSPRHSVTIVQDISARKRAEEQRDLLEKQLKKLSDISKELLQEPLGYQERLLRFVNSIVPDLADWCAVDTIDKNGNPNLEAVAHVDPEKVHFAYEIRTKFPQKDRAAGPVHVIKSRKSELVNLKNSEILRSVAVNDEHLRLISALGLKSYICVPIEAHGEVIGALTLVSEKNTYSDIDLLFASQLADRVALALYNSKLFNEAKNAVKARDEFMSICSHELNTPLTSMSMQFQMAQKLIDNKDDKVYNSNAVNRRVKNANSQIKRMTSLISEMLDVSRINFGKFSINKEPINLEHILIDALDKLREQLETLNIDVKLNIETGDYKLMGDDFKLEQVISNLITNAMKYGESKPINLTLRNEGNSIAFLVKDYGAGIPKGEFDRIFQRFERVVLSNGVSGLGLGLYISKEVINAHGGTITLSSELNKGTEFKVTLPKS
jgi:PAS domain S-box-containing protein